MKDTTKKFLSLILVLTVLCSGFSACGVGKDESKPENVKLWWAYNTENLMKDIQYPELMEHRDAALRMGGIRGDVESVQLMITPGENVGSFDFQMGDLTSSDGSILCAEQFEIYAQWYTEITESYNTSAYYGFYPDALVPIKNYQQKGYDTIQANQNQGIWLQVNIPAEQNAGTYTGIGTLDLDGEKYQIPVTVVVYDAMMPAQNHVQTLFDIWYDLIEDGEGYYSEELGKAYYDFLVSKRLMPTKAQNPIWNVNNMEEYSDWAAEKAADPNISTYSLPYIANINGDERSLSPERVTQVLTALAEKNIELRQAGDLEIDLFKKATFYLGSICDEPAGACMQTARDCDLIITQCKAEVANTYFKDRYPDLYDSLMSLPHIVTSAYNAEMVGSDTVGGVQTWCGQFHTWHSEEQRQTYYDRRDNSEREYGEGLWWYGCESPRVPFPNFHMDDDGIVTRLVPWMMFEYDVEGMIYWCVNYYNTEDIYTYPSVFLNTVGDGQLVYPGAKFDIFGPLSSRRLESIREGIEDYEYLWMIESAIIAYNETNGTDYDPKELMDCLYDGLYKGMIPERENSEFFAQRRVEILKLLEQFNADPVSAIQSLENKQ